MMTVNFVLQKLEELSIECLLTRRYIEEEPHRIVVEDYLYLPQCLMIVMAHGSFNVTFKIMYCEEDNYYEPLMWPEMSDQQCLSNDVDPLYITGMDTIDESEFEWMLLNVKKMMI